MTSDILIGFVAIVLSLLCAYAPLFKTWYNKKEADTKAVIFLVLLAIVTVGVFVLTCLGVADYGIACTRADAIMLAKLYVEAMIASQATFMLAVEPFKSAA